MIAPHHTPSIVTPGFEPVEDAFQQLQIQDQELGSALCVYLKGQPIINLYAGYTSPDRTHPWKQDTIVSLFSAGKALTALCLLHLIDRGKAKLDDTVITYWPEFSRADTEKKSCVTLNHLLHHSSGLPTATTNRPGDVFNWLRMISAMENAPLLWPAGSKTAYHAVTFGHLLGEIVRRISGKMPSDYFMEHFAKPLDIDLSIRLFPEDSQRLAACDGNNWKNKLHRGLLSHIAPYVGDWHAQYFKPCGIDYHPNSYRWKNSEAPAISGFGTATGLARLYAMLANYGSLENTRVLSTGMVSKIANERPKPIQDLGIGHKVRIGLGMYFNLKPMADFGPNPNSFGHAGMGGVTSFADPDNKIGFGYVCNHLYQPNTKSTTIIGERAVNLIDALYKCLN